MRNYDVQEIELEVSAAGAFAVLADPVRLPRWTDAFESADGKAATMRTPQGALRVGLEVQASPAQGVVDWKMTFPDGAIGWAHSRVVPLAERRCVYTFVLHTPPQALESVEGALDVQRATLARELRRLKDLLERR
ncbi:MAG TPA: SRPBCC family protein [Candidatus Krumholzibacteria bacterium]|nr:SRPBCC family protein [Candidatus Krumholzibacteria bacterium]